VAAGAPVIAEVARRRRRQLTEQAQQHFAEELAALPEDEAHDVLAALDMLCQFESVEGLRVERGLTAERTRQVLVTGLRALLGHPAG
jgi:hypothetical protein